MTWWATSLTAVFDESCELLLLILLQSTSTDNDVDLAITYSSHSQQHQHVSATGQLQCLSFMNRDGNFAGILH